MALPPPATNIHPTDIRLHNLTLGYERHPAIHHLDTVIPAGDLLAVVGPNGAGKSTLIKALAGVLQPMQGHVEGLPRHANRANAMRVAYLPQRAEMDRSFPISVTDMVAMGLWHELGAWGRLSANHRTRCAQALNTVGLNGFGHRTIDTLSGGQFQRALFARLLLQDAPVILLDEPFVGVDTRTTRDLLALLHTWHAQGRTVVAVLHDMDQVHQHFPHTMLLARELVAHGPTALVLTDAHLQRARQLNEAFDDEAPACQGNAPSSPGAPHE
jgi:zinc/manganese transport system ATP-binding protein